MYIYPYNRILLAIKRNEVLICATILSNLENIMLSERSQSERTTFCKIPFDEMSRMNKSIETESRPEADWGIVGGNGD